MAEQEFYSILTEKGKEKEMKCLNGECAYDIWEIAVGDGNGSYYEPETTQIALKNECWRGLVARCENEDETRYAIAHIPADVGGFTIREIGAFDKAGNLLIIGKCAKNIKKLPETGDIKQLSYRVDLSIINKLVLPFIIDPSINTPSINYVEKHFQALNEKSKPNGYAPLDDKAKVPLKHLQCPYIPFCFNSGAVDENGEPALLQLSTVMEVMQSETEGQEPETVEKKIITLKSPATYTDGNGKTVNITKDLTLDATDYEPGEYSLRVANRNGEIVFFGVEGGKTYRQKNPPKEPNLYDLWQDLSVAPYRTYCLEEYGTSLEDDPDLAWQITDEVEAGVYTAPAKNSDLSGGGGV